MNTKSIIQIALENMQSSRNTKVNLTEGLTKLMDKYIVDDAVFALKNDEIHEVVNGFMSIDESYDELEDAINNFDWKSSNSVVRITRNERFQVGHYYKFLTECAHSEHILDIDNLEDIR